MWFVWIGNIIVTIISYFVSKIALKSFKIAFLIPLTAVYIGMMVASFGLFATALIYIINSVYDLINLINVQSTTSGVSSVFKCFFYLLDCLGISDSLKTGVALIVSDILAIVVLKATMAGKNTVKEIITIFSKVF